MTRSRGLQAAALVVVVALVAWGATIVLERLVTPVVDTPANGADAEFGTGDVAHITAVLFYATEDGQALARVSREVPLATGEVAQGRAILEALLAPPPEPYLSVLPEATTLRAFHVTERGDAFVDLSAEASTNHPGGSFTELLTVYAIVNTITVNLPTVQRVQILVDGREADTLAGHVDLRRPLTPDLSLVREATGGP